MFAPLPHPSLDDATFDTPGYAKRLREAGISSEQAEAHAEAAREFVMGELVTRYDLEATGTAVRQAITLSESRLETRMGQQDSAIAGLRQELESQRRDFASALDRSTLQMTVRLGGMIAIALAILATIVKL